MRSRSQKILLGFCTSPHGTSRVCVLSSPLSEPPETGGVVTLIGTIHPRIVPRAYSARDRAETQAMLLAEQLREAWLLSNTNIRGTQPESDRQAVPTSSGCTQLRADPPARGAKPLRLTLFSLYITERVRLELSNRGIKKPMRSKQKHP